METFFSLLLFFMIIFSFCVSVSVVVDRFISKKRL
jgi:hypothetical protein